MRRSRAGRGGWWCRVADSVSLYWRLVGAHVRSQLQYRASFALDVIGMFAISFLDFIVVLIIFSNVHRLGAFSVREVALLYGGSGLAFAFADVVVGHLDEFNERIRTGTFDLFLIRPRGTLFQVVASDFHLRRVGKALQATLVLGWALASLDIDWNAGRVLMIPLMVASGTVIFVSVWLFMICIVFWAVEGREAANAFTYGGHFLTQYPIDVYAAWLRRLLAYLIPMGFVAYFPALYVLDKPDPLGLPSFLRFSSPFVAVASGVAAAALWRFAVRHYRSAGG
jgi:ABC-2 type transport system permease protein